MKFPRIIFALFLICFAVSFADSQTKPKDKKSEQKLIEVKANVMVLNAANQFVDDIKAEDLKVFEDGVVQKVTKITKKNSFNVGLVIDKSGSTRTQLGIIAGTANLIVNNFREKDEAFVVSFVSSDKINVEQEWTSDKDLLKKGIVDIYTEGGATATLDAIYLAAEKLAQKKDDSQRNTLILISDCEDRDSYYKLKDVLKSLKEKNIEVYILGFTQELSGESGFDYKSPKQKATELAETIASQTRGMAYFPKWSKKDQDKIIEAAKAIVFELRSQYVIEYTSTNQKRGDNIRKIAVEVANNNKGEKRQVFVRESIFISKE